MIAGSAVVLVYIRNFSRHRPRFSWVGSPGRLKNRFQDQFSNHSLDGKSFSLVLLGRNPASESVSVEFGILDCVKQGKLWT
ncbi:hypothetical protein DLM76_15140 [Leptospira yasudae]|nr:hypothetical protein DLM76_15140 [Leptospira yasudae]TGK24768.1 hypothetical protein EHQ05_17915 [Leptospira yasudae]TGM09347.1 hypothetical protein EHQ86_01560 [Leptospira yasudae]TGM96435.1 hypothetical protein EHR10_16920 [Leptospira yasudae]